MASLRREAMAASNSSLAASSGRAHPATRAPVEVSFDPEDERASRGWPILRSKRARAREAFGWARPMAAAALERLPSSSVRTSRSRSCKFGIGISKVYGSGVKLSILPTGFFLHSYCCGCCC
ncbi:hypothetical protein HMPREF3198_00899 [Winkia neuii]|nr:hypothetical protein HMPREF3198_00899 [Winkia neuii]